MFWVTVLLYRNSYFAWTVVRLICSACILKRFNCLFRLGCVSTLTCLLRETIQTILCFTKPKIKKKKNTKNTNNSCCITKRHALWNHVDMSDTISDAVCVWMNDGAFVGNMSVWEINGTWLVNDTLGNMIHLCLPLHHRIIRHKHTHTRVHTPARK